MKTLLSLFISAAIFMTSCGQPGERKPVGRNDQAVMVGRDTEQIKEVIRRAYKWYYTSQSEKGLVPVSDSTDSRYIGIDMDNHKLRLEEITNTGLFAAEFIDNYDTMIRTVGRKLKSGELEWPVGEVPAFGSGADPWCECQDYPDENPWDVVVTFLSIDDKKATVNWIWSDAAWKRDFPYVVRLAKTDGTWKISYLKGFERDGFLRKWN